MNGISLFFPTLSGGSLHVNIISSVEIYKRSDSRGGIWEAF